MHLEKSGFISLNLNVPRTVKEDKEEEEEKELQKKQLFSLEVHLDERNAFVFLNLKVLVLRTVKKEEEEEEE